jgi:hypothetical protein
MYNLTLQYCPLFEGEKVLASRDNDLGGVKNAMVD